jgi:AcrR family transcriptional regulator
MPRPSREAEILDAALACFAELGYDATRVKHIARRAGVSDAALYRHHPSKEAVALALFATHMRRFSEAFQAVAGDQDRSVEERVRALVATWMDARAAAPDAHAFVLGHQGRFLSALPADFPYPIRIVDRLLQQGQEDGTVRDGPVRVLSALVLGCMNWPAIVAQHARAANTIDLSDADAVDVIADGAWAAVAAGATTRRPAPAPTRR